MASYNKVILMGNLVSDPELRHTAGSNLPVARTRLAVNRKYKDKEEVMFIDIVVFGKTAETLHTYAKKGAPLLVDGRLNQSSWEDPNGGGKRYKHEVIVETFQFLRGSKERSDEDAPGGMYNAGTNAGDSGRFNSPSDQMEDDDIPF